MMTRMTRDNPGQYQILQTKQEKEDTFGFRMFWREAIYQGMALVLCDPSTGNFTELEFEGIPIWFKRLFTWADSTRLIPFLTCEVQNANYDEFYASLHVILLIEINLC